MIAAPVGRMIVKKDLSRQPTMRVPDHVLKCVGFLCEQSAETNDAVQADPIGSGFFVSVKSSIQPLMYLYFVTARHVVKGKEKCRLCFSVNNRDGEIVTREIVEPWYFHPDSSVDVALTPVAVESALDIKLLSPDSIFATTQSLVDDQIGIGDTVFAPGLFDYVPGTKRHLPIMRQGTIAMMPEEQVQVESGFADVILVEIRSMKGLSGSPVFVRPTVSMLATNKRGEQEALHGVSGEFRFLGLLHGHWDEPIYGVNMGIGIVVPAAKVREALFTPELIELRREVDERVALVKSPSPD